MAKVSVIIPVYCAERYLLECLDSVLKQTLRGIEVVCVDDGSTDGSAAILADYAARDPRVRVLKQTNAGAAVARNRALDCARGDYVAFMDSDDLYPSDDTLERLLDAAVAGKHLLCGGAMEHLLPDGSFTAVACPPHYGFTTYLYSRSMLEGIRFPERRYFEDPPFLVAARAKAGTSGTVGLATYRYRVEYRPRDGMLLRDEAKARDFFRGLTDVVRLSRAGGLSDVYEAVRAQCRAPGLTGLALSLLGHDARNMRWLTALQGAFPEGELLPLMEAIGCMAASGRDLPHALGHALRHLKASVGSFVPDGVKFWRKAES